jgi:transcriptional regulator with XRE-family HTH domain
MTSLEIKEFRKKYNLSQEDLANLLGVTITTVRSWEYNQRNISSSAIKVIETYIQSGNGHKSDVTPIPYDNYMVVEYADLSTAAGKLGVENPAILPEMKKRLIPKEFDEGNYLVVSVDGDSMDNGSNISIPDGTEILIKEYNLHNGDKLPIRNNLFVIVSKTGTVFKQIIEHNSDDGFIVCHSYNSKYKDFPIQLDDIIQIFIYRKIVSFRPSIPEITI